MKCLCLLLCLLSLSLGPHVAAEEPAPPVPKVSPGLKENPGLIGIWRLDIENGQQTDQVLYLEFPPEGPLFNWPSAIANLPKDPDGTYFSTYQITGDTLVLTAPTLREPIEIQFLVEKDSLTLIVKGEVKGVFRRVDPEKEWPD